MRLFRVFLICTLASGQGVLAPGPGMAHAVGGGGGTVAFDALMTGGNGSGGNSAQVSGASTISSAGMTVGASATCIVGMLTFQSGGVVPSGVTMTWNATSMTSRASASYQPTGADINTVYLFVLPSPATGNHTLAAAWTGTLDAYMSSISFSGTNTSTCINTSDTATITNNASLTVTSGSTGATVAVSSNISGDPTMNQTAIFANSPFSQGSGGSYAIGGTSNIHTFTFGGGANQASAGVHVIP